MDPSARIHILDQSFIVVPQSGNDNSGTEPDRTAIIGSNAPARNAAASDQQKPKAKAVTVTQKMSAELESVPQRIFDDEESKSASSSSKGRRWFSSSSHTPVDGFAKGMFAFGHSVVKGVTGVFSEPVKGAKQDGGVGFLKGLGKGMAGLVFRPLSGAMLLTSKTIEGFVNTPDTIAWGVTRHFAVPLQLSLARAVQSKQTHITYKCFQSILKRGLEQEGIFRLSSQQSTLDAIKSRIDDGDDVDLDNPSENLTVHDVASLLKLYFRLLPDPLFPFVAYDPLMELMELVNNPNYDEDEVLVGLKDLIASLPLENQHILLQLCVLMNEIAEHSVFNKMNYDGLCIVMSPSVIRPPETKSESLDARAKVLVQMTAVQAAFKLMITKWSALFDTDALLNSS